MFIHPLWGEILRYTFILLYYKISIYTRLLLMLDEGDSYGGDVVAGERWK